MILVFFFTPRDLNFFFEGNKTMLTNFFEGMILKNKIKIIRAVIRYGKDVEVGTLSDIQKC